MPTIAAPARRWTDAACVALLAAFATLLFIRHAPLLAHTRDGFTFTYLIDQGFLGYFRWEPAKISGRPFAGMSYRIVHDLLGGSVVAYGVFQTLCLAVTAVAVYAIVRRLAPGRPGLAWAAGVLRLTWSFDRNIVTNAVLNIVFAETLFALGLLALVLCMRPRGRGPRQLVLATAMGACVLIAAGTYQTLWPVIALTPLLVAPRVRETGHRGWTLLGVWYAMLGLGAALSIANLVQFPNRWLSLGPARILGDWLTGIRAVLLDTFWQPAREMIQTCTSGHLVVAAIATVVFAGVAIVLGRGPARERGGRPLAALAGLGLAIVVASLLPPSVKDAAEYGNRFGYVAGWGWLVLVLAGLAWTTGSPRRPWRVAGGVFAAYLVFITTAVWGPRMDDLTRIGAWSHVHYIRVMEHLAGVQDDTVVFVDGGRFERDNAATTHLRMLSNTWETFWLHDAEVAPVRKRYLLVHSPLVLKTTREDLAAMDIAPWAKFVRRPIPFAASKMRRSRIDVDQRVTLRWHRVFNQYRVDDALSNRARLDPAGESAFGATLYPDAARWFGGVFVDRQAYTVIARADGLPTPAFGRYDWYPPRCALAVVTADTPGDDATVPVTAATARIHLAVPAGTGRAGETGTVVTLRYRGDAETLHVRHVEGDTAWPLPCDGDARTWRSPPLSPGYHTLLLRTAEDTAAAIETVTLEPADG